MSYDIVVMEDCASNYGVFDVEGSRGAVHTVTLGGSEGPAHCTCPSFFYKPGEVFDKTCKHTDLVIEEACLYNPQWREGKADPRRPDRYLDRSFTGSKCPDCGGPMVAVRRAV